MATAAASEQRYRRLFDRYSRQVYAYCRRRTDPTAAADAAAETFTVAWRRLDDIPEGDAALGWLYGAARRVLANEFRRTRRECLVVCVSGRVRGVSPFYQVAG